MSHGGHHCPYMQSHHHSTNNISLRLVSNSNWVEAVVCSIRWLCVFLSFLSRSFSAIIFFITLPSLTASLWRHLCSQLLSILPEPMEVWETCMMVLQVLSLSQTGALRCDHAVDDLATCLASSLLSPIGYFKTNTDIMVLSKIMSLCSASGGSQIQGLLLLFDWS